MNWLVLRKKYHWKISRKEYQEYRRKQYHKHRKKILAYMNARHWRKREELNLKSRIYNRQRRLDPMYRKKLNAQSRRYYRLNRKKILRKMTLKSRTPKQHARMMLYYAVKAGFLHRPNQCSSCKETTKVQAHHHNGYTNPLDIIWLCRRCHGKAHWIRH